MKLRAQATFPIRKPNKVSRPLVNRVINKKSIKKSNKILDLFHRICYHVNVLKRKGE